MIHTEPRHIESSLEDFLQVEQAILREDPGRVSMDLVGNYLSLARRLGREPKVEHIALYRQMLELEDIGEPAILSEFWWLSRLLTSSGKVYWPRLPWSVVSQSDPEDFPLINWREIVALYAAAERPGVDRPVKAEGIVSQNPASVGIPGLRDPGNTSRLDHLLAYLKQGGYKQVGGGQYERIREPQELNSPREQSSWSGAGERWTVTVSLHLDQECLLGDWLEEEL